MGQIQEINICGSLPEGVAEHGIVERFSRRGALISLKIAAWAKGAHVYRGSSTPFPEESLGSNQWLEILRRTDKFIITPPSDLKNMYY